MYSSCRVHSELRRFWRFAQAYAVASCCSRHCIVAPAHRIRAIRTCKHLKYSKSIHNSGKNGAATVGCTTYGSGKSVDCDRTSSAGLGLFCASQRRVHHYRDCARCETLKLTNFTSWHSHAAPSLPTRPHRYQVEFFSHIHLRPTFRWPKPTGH